MNSHFWLRGCFPPRHPHKYVPTSSVARPTIGVPAQPRTYTFAANGLTKGIVFNVNFGDGSIIKASPGGPSIKLNQVYTTTDSFTIKVTATDTNGVVSQPATHFVKITAAALETDPTDRSKTDGRQQPLACQIGL